MARKIEWDELTPLTEDNAAYEPEMEEIIEYAEFIGLQLPEDNKYLYIAREGLKSPLPPFWQACEDGEGELFFRNKKTRAVTSENPLDELYVKKVREIRQLEAMTHVFSINEESAANESSGVIRSRLRGSHLRESDRSGHNPSQLLRVMERHITEESLELENSPAEQPSPTRSELQTPVEPEWKTQQRLQVAALQTKIERMVPSAEELITSSSIGSRAGLEKILDLGSAARLSELRLRVQERRAQLEHQRRQRRELEQLLDEIRGRTVKY